MFDYFPLKVKRGLSCLCFEKLYEVRVRAACPILIDYGDERAYLCERGATLCRSAAIFFTADELSSMIFEMCGRSLYAHADKLCRGFISLPDGVRVGICGECVVENGRIISVKNISSINFRVSHAVKGCSRKVLAEYGGSVKNTVVISPPGAGKTTLIRDIAETISEKLLLNVLVVDERNEICPLIKNRDCIDCITFSPKKYAFENGIRAMSPDVIVTDEIFGSEDVDSVCRACGSGVKTIATVHGSGISTIKDNSEFLRLAKYIELYVVLGDSGGKGRISAMYGADFNQL